MRKLILAAAMLGLAASVAGPAAAGIYTDDLSRCLVRTTSPDDQAVLMRWLFATFSGSPVIGAMSNTTDKQRAAADKEAADLFQRLLLADCRKETVNAVKYEGDAAIESSFSTLGEVAVQGLMTDPQVSLEVQRFVSYFDKEKFKALVTEVGVPGREAKGSAGK